MGGPGGYALKYRAYSARPSGQFPPGDRLGRVYGCGYKDPERTGPADGIYPVGRAGKEQEEHADQPEASDPGIASPKPAVSEPGIFRQPAFQQDQ